MILLDLSGSASLARRSHGGSSWPAIVVVGHDLDRRACDEARAIGVEVVAEPGLVADRCGTIFLSLPDSTVVDEVVWGRAGLSTSCARGLLDHRHDHRKP